MSFFLLMFGVTFLIIGICCMKLCTEFSRGVGFFIIGLLMFMPGMYGSIILYRYLRGQRGYTYKQLPEME